jgi:ParB family transcriptional regulator, chromosome partitioning protein
MVFMKGTAMAAKPKKTEASAAATLTGIITVGLDQLELCDFNVRKTEAETDIDGLADDIAAHGLLTNLTVVALWAPGEAFQKYGVVAGSRRFRALTLLHERGAIGQSHAVPVLVIEKESAREASLSENLSRVAMNPVDEFEAFSAVLFGSAAKDPQAVKACARRFGVTVRHVEQRLRLAALSPVVRDALRDGVISLDAARAYGTLPDHALQEDVFADQARAKSQPHHAAAIRDQMRGRTYRADDGWVKFVGIDAYLKAGGTMAREMFMGAEDAEVLTDCQLLERLATEMGVAAAKVTAAMEGFADGVWAPGFRFALNVQPPAGFEYWGGHRENVSGQEWAVSIAVYWLGDDGMAVRQPYWFRPIPALNAEAAAEQRRQQEDRIAEAIAPIDWPAMRKVQDILLTAARMAAPRFAGTPLEGRMIWPSGPSSGLVADCDDEGFMLTIGLMIPRAEVEAQLAAAEAQWDAENAGNADDADLAGELSHDD